MDLLHINYYDIIDSEIKFAKMERYKNDVYLITSSKILILSKFSLEDFEWTCGYKLDRDVKFVNFCLFENKIIFYILKYHNRKRILKYDLETQKMEKFIINPEEDIYLCNSIDNRAFIYSNKSIYEITNDYIIPFYNNRNLNIYKDFVNIEGKTIVYNKGEFIHIKISGNILIWKFLKTTGYSPKCRYCSASKYKNSIIYSGGYIGKKNQNIIFILNVETNFVFKVNNTLSDDLCIDNFTTIYDNSFIIFKRDFYPQSLKIVKIYMLPSLQDFCISVIKKTKQNISLLPPYLRSLI